MNHPYSYQRRYTGPLQAVILDLAGTCVDYGSLAPIQAFLRLFDQEGLELSEAEAREPMGTEKREHIRQLLAMPRIRKQWQNRHGTLPDDADIERLYQAFVPLQTDTIAGRAHLIPGALALQAWCESHNVRLGTNTGYNRDMVNAMQPHLEVQGFRPQSIVCATEVPQGRPAPHMSLKNALELEVTAVQACVKVDDTGTGIEEGLNAGMWTVAVTVSGNAIGLDQPDWQALPEPEKARRREQAHAQMARAGAHYIIDSIKDLPETLSAIQHRIRAGETP